MQLFKSKIEKIAEALEKLGTKNIQHTRSTSLYNHLTRVQRILEEWGCDEDTQLAGLCHSLYSTEYFKGQVLNIDERKKLQKIIGEQAERLVYFFALLDRNKIQYFPDEQKFVCLNYHTKEVLQCTTQDSISLLHIMLANDIDHIDTVGIGSKIHTYTKYTPFQNFFLSKALLELNKIQRVVPVKFSPEKDTGVFVRFIAHSGVQIADGTTSLLIDPWLYDSKREMPIIDGFDPTQYTIDYLTPEPKNSAHELAPDIVCLSHFHTHHSPLHEIIAFLKIKPLTIICPPLEGVKLDMLKQKIGDFLFERIHFIFIKSDQEIRIGNVYIRAMIHRQNLMPHLMFYVQLHNKSIMHIVDAAANIHRDRSFGFMFSDEWKRVDNTKPDFLFIGAAGHNKKVIENGVRIIKEATTLTPMQAAQLTARIMPKNVGIIGIYNHSVWDDRYEMTASTSDAENLFYWALSFLVPSISIKKLLPGDTFSI